MVSKKGIVMEVTNKEAYVLSDNGEFYSLRIKGAKPNIGEEYFGEEINKTGILKHLDKISIAACVAIIAFSSTAVYAYYKPVSTVVLKGSSTIELRANRFDRVISVKTLDNNNDNIANSVKINNKLVDDALVDILKQIPQNSDKVIDINVTGKNVNIDKFKNSIVKNNLTAKIVENDKVEQVIGGKNQNSKNGSYKKHDNIKNNINKNNDNNKDSNKNNNNKNITATSPNKNTGNNYRHNSHNDTKIEENNKNHSNRQDKDEERNNKNNRNRFNEMRHERNYR